MNRKRSRAAKKGWETRRAREREAVRRARQKSAAAKRGWETRRAREHEAAEFLRLRADNERLVRELETARAELVAKEAARVDAERYRDVLQGKLSPKEYLGQEEYDKAIKELAAHFEEPTAEERIGMMRARWREVEAMLGYAEAAKTGSRQMLILWAQRNGYEPREFWAEYDRRRGRRRAA